VHFVIVTFASVTYKFHVEINHIIASVSLFVFQADLNKLVGKLHDELQRKNAIKVELQNCIQKLKVTIFIFLIVA